MRRARLALAVAALALLACGDDDVDGAAAADAGAPSSTGVTDDAGDATDTTSGGDDAGAGTESVPIGDPAAGSCEVRASGDVELDYRSAGGAAAVTSSHWLSAEELQQSEALPGFVPVGLLLYCQSDAGDLVTLSKESPDDIAFGPGDVTFESTDISVFTADGDLFAPDGPVTVTLTAFDDDHIAGATEFTATSGLGNGTASVTVAFDYDNPTP